MRDVRVIRAVRDVEIVEHFGVVYKRPGAPSRQSFSLRFLPLFQKQRPPRKEIEKSRRINSSPDPIRANRIRPAPPQEPRDQSGTTLAILSHHQNCQLCQSCSVCVSPYSLAPRQDDSNGCTV